MGEDLLYTVVAAIAIVVGLVGTLLPIVPGIAFMWIAAFLYGLLVGYTPFGIIAMVLLTIITVVSIVLGVVVPRKAAATAGASTTSQIIGVIGAVIGFFVIPVIGAIIGALAGLLVAEYGDKGELGPAWQATIITAKGFGIGALIQFGVGFAFLLIWSIWAATVVF